MGLRATSGIKGAFSCQKGEVEDSEEGAQQSSGGDDQSSFESAEWSLVVRAPLSQERASRIAPNSQEDAEWLERR